MTNIERGRWVAGPDRRRAAAAAVLAALAVITLAACGSRAPGTGDAVATPDPAVGDEGLGPGPSGEGPDPGAGPGGNQTPSPVAPAAEDCVSYNPSNLTIEASGDAWRMRDGNHSMRLFDTKADADGGLAVARNWTRMCFIGRGNDRPDRYRYIITYWREPSGLPLGLAPAFGCITYDPAQLAIYSGAAHPADPDQSDWALYSGGTPLLFLDTEPDAARAKLVASEYTKLCVIGHGNDRPDPYRYVMHYWRS